MLHLQSSYNVPGPPSRLDGTRKSWAVASDELVAPRPLLGRSWQLTAAVLSWLQASFFGIQTTDGPPHIHIYKYIYVYMHTYPLADNMAHTKEGRVLQLQNARRKQVSRKERQHASQSYSNS